MYAELMRTTVNKEELYTKWEAREHPAAHVICWCGLCLQLSLQKNEYCALIWFIVDNCLQETKLKNMFEHMEETEKKNSMALVHF